MDKDQTKQDSTSKESNLRVGIVDDEPLAANRLARMISDLDGYDTVGTASSSNQALNLVLNERPDILLLDIEMPGPNGLEIARDIENQSIPTPAIIFCTAYDQYAIDAFTTQASGYLLKPVKIAELELALQKAAKPKQTTTEPLEQTAFSTEAFVTGSEQSDAVRIRLTDILYFKAENKLVFAHSSDKNTNSATDQCTAIDQSLDQIQANYGDDFVRAHRNSLVAVRHIKRLFRDGTGKHWISVGNNETPIAVSRRNIATIKSKFR